MNTNPLDVVWTALTPSQADGFACVECGVAFGRSRNAHAPVGRALTTGSQVFACTGTCEQVATEFEGSEHA